VIFFVVVFETVSSQLMTEEGDETPGRFLFDTGAGFSGKAGLGGCYY